MSMINKLSIRGIRSFGNEMADEQKILFESPLTLIVGENGCGKTTLIECAKYGATGETPPGTDKGKTFVHDPKVFRTSSSLGQVKLMVTDIRGNSVTCVRSMKTELLKTGKVKFETLDSTMSYDGKDGKREENGRRVEEVNREMCSALGVSKAIINNVIFCHQEDSNWPLDEGKKVKEKFDAIFGTTEYNKAIDKVIKIRKEYLGKATACKQEKGFLEEIKKDAQKKSTDLDMLSEKHKKMVEQITQLEESVKPIDDKLEALKIKEAQYGKLHGEKVIFESSIKNCETNAENYRKKIKEHLSITVEEIEEQLKKFEETKKQNSTKLLLMNDKYAKTEREENQLRETIAKMNAKSETLINKIGELQDLMGQRVDSMKTLCKALEIDLPMDFDDDLPSEGLKKLLRQIHDGIEKKERALENIKVEADLKESETQQKIDKVRGEKISSETNLQTQRKRIATLSDSKSKINREISSIETSMPKFHKLVEDIESAQKNLEKVNSESNVEELEERMMIVETEKRELENQITNAEKIIEQLESVSNIVNEIKSKKKDLLKEESDFDHIKNKNTSTLKILFASKVIEGNFKNIVQELTEKLKTEIKIIKESTDEAKMKESRLKTQREHLRAQHKQKKDELSEIKEKIDSICDGGDFMDVFIRQKEKVDKLNMDLAVHKSSEKFFKHYISDIQQDPSCPLCHGNLRNQGDDLKEEIDEKIRLLPVQISETEKKLKDENEKFNKLNELKSSHDGIQKLENEVKKLEDDKKRIDKEYQENNSEIEALGKNIIEPDLKFKKITPIFFSDMVRLDDLTKSIVNKTKLIDDLNRQIPAELPKTDLEEAKKELRQFRASMKSKSDLFSSLSKKVHETRSNINNMQDSLNKMISQKMSNQEKVQGLDNLKKQLNEMIQEAGKIELEIKEEERKLIPIKQKLESLIASKQLEKNEANKKVKLAQDEINNYRVSNSELDRLNNDIASLEKEDLVKANERVLQVINDSKDRIKQLCEQKIEENKEIKRLSEDVVNHESKQRNLQDNMELRKIEQEKKTSEESLHNLLKTMGDMNPRKLLQETKSLRELRDNINDERQSIRGRVTESKERIKSAQNEMKEPRYCNANKNFMRECYKEAVLKALIDDLHKYRAALERSLLKFHAEKMAQVNQITRELWNNIYKGNDIDYIMIKTDEEEGPKSVSDKKRSYNYRVVQAKNGGSEIDMRGRCSAGQKVLACLLIRIALADTFSVNCGILALDEPTTNLDHNNIHSLCDALKKIVDERAKIGNFMLIIITHDEEFVRAMERAEYYYKLSRDSKGRSRIDKILNM